jgi:hypothetical protein
MIQAITVAPSAGGWTVKSDAAPSEMFFQSGASAEAAARSLGARIAEEGEEVEIEIFLRDGTLGGRYAYPRSSFERF